VLATAIHFHLILIFVGKAAAFKNGALTGIYSKVRLPGVPANMRLGHK